VDIKHANATEQHLCYLDNNLISLLYKVQWTARTRMNISQQ